MPGNDPVRHTPAEIEQEERLAIMIHDGGLSDIEARYALHGDEQQELFTAPLTRSL